MMHESDEGKNPTCFVIMPISTPTELVSQYHDDADHFEHVFDRLFVPAIKNAGFTPQSPASVGSEIIQGDIIQQLVDADLVLCDMSALNVNVFYELGIRTALDKPVALVVDDRSEKPPFDVSVINYHQYDARPTWEIEYEREKLTGHITTVYERAEGRNAMWKTFGVQAVAGGFGEGVTNEDRLRLLSEKIDAIAEQIPFRFRPQRNPSAREVFDELNKRRFVFEAIESSAGPITAAEIKSTIGSRHKLVISDEALDDELTSLVEANEVRRVLGPTLGKVAFVRT